MSRKSFCHSGSQTLFFGGREATTGNASAVRRLLLAGLVSTSDKSQSISKAEDKIFLVDVEIIVDRYSH